MIDAPRERELVMRRFKWSLWNLTLAWCLGFAAQAHSAPPTRPAEVSRAESQQVRALIEAQLKAFADDDAARAFSYATPELREVFGDAEKFMDMVRTAYPVVYRPSSIAFLKPARAGNDKTAEVTQGVQMTDDSGTPWIALYHLQRQRDKSWRISGCEVVQAEGKVAAAKPTFPQFAVVLALSASP